VTAHLRRRGGIRKVLLILALAAIGLGAVAWGIFRWLGHSYRAEVEDRLSQIRARGEPVTFDDLTPEPIPPEENAASIYRQAFAAYVEPDEEAEDALFYKDLEERTAEDREALRRWVKQNQRALVLARRASLLEKSQFVTERTGVEQELPHLRALRHLSYLLGQSIDIHLSDGEPKAALEECLVSLRLAEHVGSGTLVEYGVEVALVCLASADLQRVLASESTEDLDLGPMMEGVRQLLRTENLPDALQWERVNLWHALNNMETIGLSEEQVEALKPEGGLRLWMEGERLALLELFDRALALSEKPWHETKSARQELDAWVDELADKIPPRPLPMLSSGPVSKTPVQRSMRRARLLQMALGIELEWYRRRTGSFPDSLQDLTLTRLQEPPIDPFSGRLLLYQHEGKGYVLYSVGENGVDDNGEWGWRQHRGKANPDTGKWQEGWKEDMDDISWPVNFPHDLEVSEWVD